MNVQEIGASLSAEFPFLSSGNDVGGSLTILEARAYDAIDVIDDFDFSAIESDLNPLHSENLLYSCLSRITNCLTLREKAHEIQIRAFDQALESKLQQELVELERRLQKLTKPAQGSDEQVEEIDDLYKRLDQAVLTPIEARKALAQAEGHGSNYAERFLFLTEMFRVSLLQAYGRAKLVRESLRQIYGIEAPLPDLSPTGYLNKLALWAQSISDQLDLELDRRRRGRVALTLASSDDASRTDQVFTLTDFRTRLAAQTFSFTLPADYFTSRGMLQPLLRSMFVEIVTTEPQVPRMWNATVRLPDNPLIPGSITHPCIAASGGPSGGSDFEIAEEVHNLSPIGTWLVTLPLRTTTGEGIPADRVSNVIIHLRTSYRRAP